MELDATRCIEMKVSAAHGETVALLTPPEKDLADRLRAKDMRTVSGAIHEVLEKSHKEGTWPLLDPIAMLDVLCDTLDSLIGPPEMSLPSDLDLGAPDADGHFDLRVSGLWDIQVRTFSRRSECMARCRDAPIGADCGRVGRVRLPHYATSPLDCSGRDRHAAEAILLSVRNGAYESLGCCVAVASHTRMLEHIVACCARFRSESALAEIAVETLVQCARHTDVTGACRMEDDTFKEDSVGAYMPQQRQLALANASVYAKETAKYAAAVAYAFPVAAFLLNSWAKPWTIFAADLMARLSVSAPHQEMVCRGMPDAVFLNIVELCNVTVGEELQTSLRSTPYAPLSHASAHCAFKPRVPSARRPSRVSMCSTLVDIDARDGALEVLLALLNSEAECRRAQLEEDERLRAALVAQHRHFPGRPAQGERRGPPAQVPAARYLSSRLASYSGFLEEIVAILEARAARIDTMRTCGELFAVLTQLAESASSAADVRRRLIALAARDPEISELLFLRLGSGNYAAGEPFFADCVPNKEFWRAKKLEDPSLA